MPGITVYFRKILRIDEEFFIPGNDTRYVRIITESSILEDSTTYSSLRSAAQSAPLMLQPDLDYAPNRRGTKIYGHDWVIPRQIDDFAELAELQIGQWIAWEAVYPVRGYAEQIRQRFAENILIPYSEEVFEIWYTEAKTREYSGRGKTKKSGCFAYAEKSLYANEWMFLDDVEKIACSFDRHDFLDPVLKEIELEDIDPLPCYINTVFIVAHGDVYSYELPYRNLYPCHGEPKPCSPIPDEVEAELQDQNGGNLDE